MISKPRKGLFHARATRKGLLCHPRATRCATRKTQRAQVIWCCVPPVPSKNLSLVVLPVSSAPLPPLFLYSLVDFQGNGWHGWHRRVNPFCCSGSVGGTVGGTRLARVAQPRARDLSRDESAATSAPAVFRSERAAAAGLLPMPEGMWWSWLAAAEGSS